MRRLFTLIFLFALFASTLPAQEHATEAGHSTEVSQSSAHVEEHAHEEATFLGLPAWIFKLVNMLLFIGLLVYLLRGPVGKAFGERKSGIRSQLEEARERRAKSDRLAQDISDRLNQIEGEVAGILQRARDEGERQKKELLVAAEAESQKILASARNEVDVNLKSARQELSDYARQLSMKRAQELIESSVTDDDRHRLFNESVDSLSEVQS